MLNDLMPHLPGLLMDALRIIIFLFIAWAILSTMTDRFFRH